MKVETPAPNEHIMNLQTRSRPNTENSGLYRGHACATFARAFAANPLQMQQTVFEAIQPAIAAGAMPGRAVEIAERGRPMSLRP